MSLSIKNSLGSTSEARTEIRIGSLVTPRYYIELCEDIDLREMSTSVETQTVCIVMDFEIDEDPHQSMCLVLAPSGASGWVARPHLRAL